MLEIFIVVFIKKSENLDSGKTSTWSEISKLENLGLESEISAPQNFPIKQNRYCLINIQ